MKLGMLTAPFPDTPLLEVADWASRAGFEALEIACWPQIHRSDPPLCRHQPHRRRRALRLARPRRSSRRSARRGIAISALGYYPNPLHPGPRASRGRHRPSEEGDRRRRAGWACRLVNTFCGGDAAKHVDANWEDALKVWPEIVAHARDNGVKLAFENCPMIFSYDEWPGGHNIAYSPYIWRRILEAWGGDVGMNFDPSHLVWQMIDQARFIREFGPHMLHVHAKDLMIDRDGLYERGILSAGIGWQVPRMPGLGEVDWSVILLRPLPGRLRRAGDHRARGPAIRRAATICVKRGFLLARDVLRPFVK